MKSNLLILVLLSLAFLPHLVWGAEFTSLVNIPGLNGNPAGGDQGFSNYINALYRLSISVAALIAVVKIIGAGVKYMFSDIVTSKSEAKADIRSSLLGLLVVISAVLILSTVNSDLTNFKILLEPVTVPEPIPTEEEKKCGEDGALCTKLLCSSMKKGGWEDVPGFATDDGTGQLSCYERCDVVDGIRGSENFENPVYCIFDTNLATKLMDKEIEDMKKRNNCDSGDYNCKIYKCDYQQLGIVFSSTCKSQCENGHPAAGSVSGTYDPKTNRCIVFERFTNIESTCGVEGKLSCEEAFNKCFALDNYESFQQKNETSFICRTKDN